MAGVIFGAKNNNKPEQSIALDSKKNSDFQAKQITRLRPTSISKTRNLKTAGTSKKASSLVKANSKKRSGYTVVLASFAGQSSALKHVKEISRRGFDAFYFTTEIKGKTWHRVGVGSFSLKSTAQGLKKELSKNKFAKGSLISKIPSNNQ